METAQTIDETSPMEIATLEDTGSLAAFSKFKGVQFVIAVEGNDKTKFEHWAAENPDRMAAWIHETTRSLRSLGDKLEAGQLEQIEALGPQRHVGILTSDDQDLGIGFTRSATLPHIRETMKPIEAKWAS
jgi:hypothetical protein